MDKNQINIDDLFRNRLSGGEEKERPGSWLAMRDLLDKEMPVQAAFNWRRMFGIITTLVVATSVSVGGYKFYAHQNRTGIAANSPATALITPKDLRGANNGNKIASLPLSTTSDATINHASKNIPVIENTSTSTTRPKRSTTTRRPAGNNNTTNDTRVATQSEGNANNNTPALNTNTNSSNDVVASNTPATHRNHTTTTATTIGQTVTHNNSTPGTQPSATTIGNSNTGAIAHRRTSARTQERTETTTTSGFTAGSSSSFNRNDPGRNINIPTSATANTYNSQPTSPTGGTQQPAFVAHKDTIQQIEVVYRRTLNPVTQKIQLKADTIARYTVVVDRLIPVKHIADEDKVAEMNNVRPTPAPGQKEKGNGEVQPLLAAKSAEAEMAASDNNLVSLSKFRVSSKLHNAWINNAERLNQFARNVSFAVARSQFYTGITGGFNSTMFSVNTLAGFHLGVTGMLAFNERWSIAAELKFYQRFNNGGSINDDYIKAYDRMAGNTYTQNGVEYQSYTWNEDKVKHNFNFTTVQTLEAPVTLRRNIGRIFGEVGMNMMYAFNVNAEEIERPNGTPIQRAQGFPVGTSTEAIGQGKPQVTLADFGSRFGLGYVIGAGYQFTPALNANFKLVQNFWDDAASDGARKVSRNLYQTPSVQFSIGYRFSQNRTVKPVDHP